MSNRPSMVIGSVAHKLLKLLAHRGGMPGFTTGDLITAAELAPGTAVHQRLTLDVEGHGWKVLRHKDKDGVQRYWMPPSERERAKKFLQKLAAEKRARYFAKDAKERKVAA